MALLPMQKLRLFVHRDQASDVLRAIQKLGMVQFEPVQLTHASLRHQEKEAFEFNHASSRLDFAVRFLSKHVPKQGGLRGMIEGDKVRTSGTKLYETVKTFDYNPLVDAAQNIEQAITTAENRIEELEEERDLLSPWRNYTEPLVYPRATERTTTLFLVAKDTLSINTLNTQLADRSIGVHTIAVDPTHYVFVCLTEDLATVEQLVREAGVEVAVLPLRRGTVEEELERIERAIVHVREDIAREEGRALDLTKHLPELKILADYMLWQREKHDLYTRSHTSEHTLVFEGWCPKPDIATLEERIKNKTEQYALESIDPTEGEVPPVEIRNNRLWRPFEAVTRLYGLPGHTELDPTVFLAGFFFLFFGLAITDFGYGLVLSVLLGYILFVYDVPKAMRPLLTLMLAGGLSTMVVGLLFGGYFGVSLEYMPAWLQTLQQFDPITNPLPVFYLALGLGVVQIVAGLALNILSEGKNGHLVHGLLNKGPWIGLFVFLCVWLGASLNLVPGEPLLYLYAVYASLAAIMLYAAYGEPSWVMKPFKALLSLYDIIGYFSDVLSYSRLLALGLATSALAYAVNLIAGMVAGVPYVGLLLMAVILVIGHLFNLAINLLGAFIHCARLQFVEFFSKFIQETGRAYTPFRRTERYVELVDAPNTMAPDPE